MFGMTDRKRWEDKHREVEFLGEPARFLEESFAHLPSGRALDLACGLGANALYLASRGFEVDALDWSIEGLSKLTLAARVRNLRVRALVCDVTRYPIPVSRYDVVICFRFLDRSLWQPMARALRPGGALLVETYTLRHLDVRPKFPRPYCLEENELLDVFAKKLRVARYREIPSETTASILAFREGERAR